ncbi:MAG: ATP-binding cassette domain-containing protein [Desulfovibrio sp.]|nr:ATP-binding cassette domain-containing protein [Desulfovibrio sp.]
METAWDIDLCALTIGYGSHIVLHNVTASFPAGRISMILGESGSGKSTLLRHIIGLSVPKSGRITIAGTDCTRMDDAEARRLRRRMGVLFQDGALLGSLTVLENVALPLTEHLRLPKELIRKEALRVLGMVELEQVADYYPSQLSGGMRKRAGLARAIITNPSLLLCDEPTSGLDPLTAARMDILLLTLHRQFPGMTILVVSHDLESFHHIADYTLVIKDGLGIFSGTKDAFYASNDPYLVRYRTRSSEATVADFSSTMDPRVSSELSRWLANP